MHSRTKARACRKSCGTHRWCRRRFGEVLEEVHGVTRDTADLTDQRSGSLVGIVLDHGYRKDQVYLVIGVRECLAVDNDDLSCRDALLRQINHSRRDVAPEQPCRIPVG